MSAPWQHNFWFWIAAACAVGGVAALWSPSGLTLERHGESVTQGRPASVDRTVALETDHTQPLTSEPVAQDSQFVGVAVLADSVADENPSTTNEPARPSSISQRQPYLRRPRHSHLVTQMDHEDSDSHVDEQSTAVLTLPDRLDEASLRQVEGRSYVTRTAHAQTAQSEGASGSSAIAPNRPVIIAGPSSRRSETSPAASPIRLKGTIVPVQQ